MKYNTSLMFSDSPIRPVDVSEETAESVVLVEADTGTALSDLPGGGTASLSKRSTSGTRMHLGIK